MSDTTNPIAPAAQEPAQGTPAAPVAQPPAPAAAAPQTAPEAPAKPAYVNPWKGRAPAPVAPAAAAPVQSSPPAASPASDPRIDALMAVLGETVSQDLGALPANVAATVRAIAGDDPVAQRKAINAMRANGLATALAAPIAPLPPPASTVQPAAPVAPTAPSVTSDDASRLAEFEKLQSAAPTIANAYRLTHADSINRALAARTSAN
jgi:2-oxoglutarate dehydrogenase E2 component (dihydrolipoamide succinyltransferase)